MAVPHDRDPLSIFPANALAALGPLGREVQRHQAAIEKLQPVEEDIFPVELLDGEDGLHTWREQAFQIHADGYGERYTKPGGLFGTVEGLSGTGVGTWLPARMPDGSTLTGFPKYVWLKRAVCTTLTGTTYEIVSDAGTAPGMEVLRIVSGGHNIYFAYVQDLTTGGLPADTGDLVRVVDLYKVNKGTTHSPPSLIPGDYIPARLGDPTSSPKLYYGERYLYPEEFGGNFLAAGPLTANTPTELLGSGQPAVTQFNSGNSLGVERATYLVAAHVNGLLSIQGSALSPNQLASLTTYFGVTGGAVGLGPSAGTALDVTSAYFPSQFGTSSTPILKDWISRGSATLVMAVNVTDPATAQVHLYAVWNRVLSDSGGGASVTASVYYLRIG